MTGRIPDRDALIAELVRLRDIGETRQDPASKFIGLECRVALYGLEQAHNAMARGEQLGGCQYLRLVTETALRVTWVVGEQLGEEGVPSEQQRLLADRGRLRLRVRALQRRDVKQVLASYRAIFEYGGSEPDEAILNLELPPRSEGEPVAPWDLKGMAITPAGRSLYAGHRLCSAVIHAGRPITRLDDVMPTARIHRMLDDAAYLCGAFADAALRVSA